MAQTDPLPIHSFTIGLDHPVLPSHFPGNPLVPGAIILDQILEGLENLGLSEPKAMGLREIKFKSPLTANVHARIEYISTPQGLRAKVMTANREIASALFGFPHA